MIESRRNKPPSSILASRWGKCTFGRPADRASLGSSTTSAGQENWQKQFSFQTFWRGTYKVPFVFNCSSQVLWISRYYVFSMWFHHVSSLAQVLEDQKAEADRWMSWVTFKATGVDVSTGLPILIHFLWLSHTVTLSTLGVSMIYSWKLHVKRKRTKTRWKDMESLNWVKCGKVHVPIVLGPAMKLLQCHSLW